MAQPPIPLPRRRPPASLQLILFLPPAVLIGNAFGISLASVILIGIWATLIAIFPTK